MATFPLPPSAPRPDADPATQVARPLSKKTLSKRARATHDPRASRAESGISTLNRARELADKGLFKEAVLLWERAMRLGDVTPLHPSTPLVWMINAGQYLKGVRFFTTHEAILHYDHPALWSLTRELFAVVCLTRDDAIRQPPPLDAYPWNQATTLHAAMRALMRGETLSVQTLLTGLDADSPFLACRRILESLMAPSHEPERILALLEEIQESSPFAPLAHLARARALPTRERITTLLALPREEQAQAARLCSAPEWWIKLMAKLERSREPGRLAALIISQAEILPRAVARATLIDLLPDCPEERIPFEKRFGPLQEIERERIFALHHERHGAPSKACSYWRKCISLLESAPENVERQLSIALIYRHMAQLEQREPHPDTARILQWQELSLKYDPDDKPCWLELLEARNRLGRDRLNFHRLADKAARRFPEDETILTFAMHAAMEKGSFKKASGVGRRIQKLNPGHDGIESERLSAHLQHARKRILDGHFAVARRELFRAERLRAEGSQPVGILAAMLEFLAGDPQRGEEILEEGRRNATQKSVHAVKAFLEACALRLPPLMLDGFRRDLIRCDAQPPDRTELVIIAGIITHAHETQPDAAIEAMALLAGQLRAGTGLSFDAKELLLICEALAITQRHALLIQYGRIGEKQWPGEPMFTCYRACGACENQPWRLTDHDFQRLLTYEEDLKPINPAAAARIRALLSIPASRLPADPLRGVPLSPARIPKPLEHKLLRELRTRLQDELRDHTDPATLRILRDRLLETLAPTEFGQRGPAVLGYLLDRALKLKPRHREGTATPQTTPRQLEMELLIE
ncbi:MAG: hypothetical protein H7834_01150 [Magnetococcus sp. YQC-9]